MTEPPVELDRRALLGALASFAALACAPKAAGVPSAPPSSVRHVLAALPAGVGVVGRRYLDEQPDEGDADRLREQLRWPRTREAIVDWHAHLDAAMLDDLERDRLVEVGGWQLTRTECRVYALAALLEEGA